MTRFGGDEPRAPDRTGFGIHIPRDRPLEGYMRINRQRVAPSRASARVAACTPSTRRMFLRRRAAPASTQPVGRFNTSFQLWLPSVRMLPDCLPLGEPEIASKKDPLAARSEFQLFGSTKRAVASSRPVIRTDRCGALGQGSPKATGFSRQRPCGSPPYRSCSLDEGPA